MTEARIIYFRAPLQRLVQMYHQKNMRGRLLGWSYDAKKDDVLIEIIVEEDVKK